MKNIPWMVMAVVVVLGGGVHGGIDLYLVGGYGFPFGGSGPYASEKRDNDISPYESETRYLNLGKGIRGEGGVGIDVHENLGLQAGFSGSFLVSGVIDEDVTEIDWGQLATTTTTATREYDATIIGMRLQVRPRASLSERVAVYCGAGGGVFMAFTESKRTTRTVSRSNNTTTTSVSTETWEYDNEIMPALTASAGVRLGLFGPLSWAGEVCCEAMNVVHEKETYTSGEGDTDVRRFERDAADRPAPPVIPATTVSVRTGFALSIR